MTDRELMQQALEALEFHTRGDEIDEALITALRERLAQPEQSVQWQDCNCADMRDCDGKCCMKQPVQEPVAWLTPKTVDSYMRPDLGYETCSKTDYAAFPVYTAPPQRKPLTEEEIDELAMDKDGLPNSHIEFARAIERAHGIGEKK